MGYRVGVDIGGTFADFCAFDESTGRLSTLKVLSRPDAPDSGRAEPPPLRGRRAQHRFEVVAEHGLGAAA